ncbi:hypothetical protein UFOVP787_209 [uncultured Caudovirales phage]|uniref:Peptidase C51 domain-containing protein n=1 Tax=uncultured Caudovirales phage TaxID=2100421 RepID=A0A6J5NZ87_9CAUD|nr:hypothetical protein UFOVP787_209 [uncultured Caudovirales phage]
MKKIILIATFVLASISLVNAANAKPNKKNNHYSVSKIVKQNNVNGSLSVPNSYYVDDSAASFFAQDRERINQNTPKLNKKFTKEVVTAYNSSTDLIGKATAYIGANSKQLGLPARLWCADFMNMITRSGSDRRAVSYMKRGTPAKYGCTNCVAVTARRGGGHVGVVSGYDNKGNPIIISGNHGRAVGVGVYAKSRVIAYRYI